MKKLKIISANLNGIRSAKSKGFYDWLKKQSADIICLQEIRADQKVLAQEDFNLTNYHCQFVCAQKKGYSGVAIFSKQKPQQITTQLGLAIFDDEGRFIAYQFADLMVISLYLHSGSSGDQRQQVKFAAMEFLEQKLANWLKSKQKVIICGDINIVHTQKDIKNFKQNQKTSGCLPEERAWLDKIFYQMGWIDSFRQIAQKDDQYTWWSNRGRAREKNVGWRIDYQIISPNLARSVKNTAIYTQEYFSDHAPYIVEYQLN